MLSQAEAEELVCARLKSHSDSTPLSIAQALERSFGWVFFIDGVQPAARDAQKMKLPRAVIVNKYSEQVIASSIDHELERLIKLYEKLLAQNQSCADNWCRTVEVRWPWERWKKRTVAGRAKEAGFYEIGRKEKES